MRLFSNIDLKGIFRPKKLQWLQGSYSNILSSSDTSLTIDWSNSPIQVIDLTGSGSSVEITLNNADVSHVSTYRLIIYHSDTSNKVLSFVTNTLVDTPLSDDLIVTSDTTKLIELVYNGINYHWINKLQTGSGSSGDTYVENNDYTSENVITIGEAYTNAISALDAVIGKLIPDLPDKINTISLSCTSTAKTGLRKSTDYTTTGLSVYYVTALTFNGSGAFYDPEDGNLTLGLDSTELGSIELTVNDDTDTSGSNLKILTDSAYDNFSDVLTIKCLLSDTDLPIDAETHTLTLETDTDSLNTSVVFRKDAVLTTATPTNGAVLPNGTFDRISGIPVLRSGDTIGITATINNCITHYMRTNISYLTSSSTSNEYGAADSSTNYVYGDSVDVSFSTTVSTSKFDSNLLFYVNGIQGDGTNTSDLTITPTNRIMVDSVSNINYAGFDHDTPLTDVSSTQLMLLNGLFQYPSGDYTDVEVGDGTTDSELVYDTISDDRYLEWNLTISTLGTVVLNFADQTGFSSVIENDSTYTLEMNLNGGDWFNANSAYSGIGVVTDGEGCLDVANSTVSSKTLTFGEVTSGLVVVRLTMTSACAKLFGQDTELVAGDA